MVGTKSSGNPHVLEDIGNKRTGAKTEEGKVRQLLGRTCFPKNASIVFKLKEKGCNECPLRPKTVTKYKDGKPYDVIIPAGCNLFEHNHMCPLTYEDHVKALKTYFIAENIDTLQLQQTLALKTLENAELCKAKEILQTTAPGFYTHKFMELATENLSNYNRIVHGEINKNVNVNIDMSSAILDAWKVEEEPKIIEGKTHSEEGFEKE